MHPRYRTEKRGGHAMATTVVAIDETSCGTRANELSIEFLSERVTVREIIRSRVYQEVTEHNARQGRAFRGLVTPDLAEQMLNGERLPRTQRRIDWEAQYEQAVRAFERNGFLLLVNDRQLTDLDEEVELRSDTTVTFLKLLPLVGG
jgi:hypothetical protein